jgi:DNA-binding NtrC family response regulator
MVERARILIVDDEPDIRLALGACLEHALQAIVVSAGDAESGLRLLRETAFDLILSDYRMPGMDGLHFLRRASELRPESPRVLMTAYPDLQLAIDALNRAGIDLFLTKPIDPDELVDGVSEILDVTRRKRYGEDAMHRAAPDERAPGT